MPCCSPRSVVGKGLIRLTNECQRAKEGPAVLQANRVNLSEHLHHSDSKLLSDAVAGAGRPLPRPPGCLLDLPVPVWALAYSLLCVEHLFCGDLCSVITLPWTLCSSQLCTHTCMLAHTRIYLRLDIYNLTFTSCADLVSEQFL